MPNAGRGARSRDRRPQPIRGDALEHAPPRYPIVTRAELRDALKEFRWRGHPPGVPGLRDGLRDTPAAAGLVTSPQVRASSSNRCSSRTSTPRLYALDTFFDVLHGQKVPVPRAAVGVSLRPTADSHAVRSGVASSRPRVARARRSRLSRSRPRPALEETDEVSDRMVAMLRLAQRTFVVHFVRVTPSVAGPGQVAGFFEVADDLCRTSLGDLYGRCDVPEAAVRISRDVRKNVRVVGHKAPLVIVFFGNLIS